MINKQITTCFITGLIILSAVGFVLYNNYWPKPFDPASSQNLLLPSQHTQGPETYDPAIVCKLSDGSIIYDPTRCERLKTYRSEKLGVEFQVHESAKVTEEGNRVYVNGKEGQWVEIIPKYNLQPLIHKVTELNGLTSNKCRISNFPLMGENYNYPKTYSVISVMANETDWDRASEGKPLLCQSKYAGLNGMTMFLADSNFPTKIAYFEIGQYSEPAGEKQDWQHTFRFTK